MNFLKKEETKRRRLSVLPKPPHFFQTHPESCVPACLRMVLSSLGFEISELDLRSLCKCQSDGTIPSNAVKAVIECGFDAYIANLELEELQNLISESITPIVYVKINENTTYFHAVVIYRIEETKIYALDPAIGEREFETSQFTKIWSRGLTIIIERRK